MKNKKIISFYFPLHNPTNQYTQNVQNIIKNEGIEVIPLRLYIYPLKDFFRCKIFNFNWIENCMEQNTETEIKAKLKYLRMVIFFASLKILRKKIVWTLHNKISHDSVHIEYKNKLMRNLAKRADAVVVHCSESIPVLRNLNPKISLKKVHLINHPNYISNYQTKEHKDYREKLGISKDDVVFMFIGQIKRYKNIEVLIEAFSSLNLQDAKLLIAGRGAGDYLEEIKKLIAENENIVLYPEFIEDDEMKGFYGASDIVVLPYDIEGSLNSGSVYMSFSLHRTVICSEIGTMKQLKDKTFSYSYSYESKDEHVKNLAACMQKAYSDNQINVNALREKGEQAFAYVSSEHSDKSIGKEYKKLYYRLAGRTYDE